MVLVRGSLQFNGLLFLLHSSCELAIDDALQLQPEVDDAVNSAHAEPTKQRVTVRAWLNSNLGLENNRTFTSPSFLPPTLPTGCLVQSLLPPNVPLCPPGGDGHVPLGEWR